MIVGSGKQPAHDQDRDEAKQGLKGDGKEQEYRDMIGPQRFASPVDRARGNTPEFEQPFHEQRGEEDRPEAETEAGKRHSGARRGGREAGHAGSLTRGPTPS